MVKRHFQWLVVGFTAAVLAACAAPRVKQNVIMPAKAPELQQTRNLAITTLDGDQHRKYTTKLEDFFTNIRVKGAPYFTVVDRNSLDAILKEQKMVNESGLFDESTAVQLGKLSGADTILSGIVTAPQTQRTRYFAERRRCSEKNKDGKCTDYQTYKVKCTKKSTNFELTARAVSVSKGSIVFSKTYSGNATNQFCEDSPQREKSDADLAQAAWTQAMNTMRHDVAPYEVQIEISLMKGDDSDLKKHKKAHELLKSGLDFADEHRLDRGCQQFTKALAFYNESPALYYNNGVCAEVDGDLDKAVTYYRKADQLTLKPVKTIAVALHRIEEKEANAAKLAEQER